MFNKPTTRKKRGVVFRVCEGNEDYFEETKSVLSKGVKHAPLVRAPSFNDPSERLKEFFGAACVQEEEKEAPLETT